MTWRVVLKTLGEPEEMTVEAEDVAEVLEEITEHFRGVDEGRFTLEITPEAE